MYDADGYRKRADAIIFKDKTFTQVLLVSSRSDPESWTVTGGGMEPHETGASTSVREAREEAGVIGTVDSFVGSFDDSERRTRTEVYILIADEMVEQWDDSVQMDRRRQWFATEEAIQETARRPCKQRYLKAACKLADERRQQTSLIHMKRPNATFTPVVLSLLLVFVIVLCVGMYMVL